MSPAARGNWVLGWNWKAVFTDKHRSYVSRTRPTAHGVTESKMLFTQIYYLPQKTVFLEMMVISGWGHKPDVSLAGRVGTGNRVIPAQHRDEVVPGHSSHGWYRA